MRTQLPLAAVRDLIAVTRSIWFAWRDQGAEDSRLAALLEIGRELRAALDLASRTEPDTVGHRAAWSRAEKATKALGQMIGEAERLAPAVHAAVKRAGFK